MEDLAEKSYLAPINIILIIVGLFALVNLALLNYFVFFNKPSETMQKVTAEKQIPLTKPVASQSAIPITQVSNSCTSECQALINTKLEQFRSELPRVSSAPSPSSQVAVVSNQPKEIFVSFGVSDSTKNTSWTDISGSTIKFNTSSYPGAKAFYFQANLKADAVDRISYSRIYDSDHGVGVDGSEINYTGMDSTFVESGPLKFLSGTLTLRIQIHSLNGNLAVAANPRIRVAY